MDKQYFDNWIQTNAELSVIKEEAEKLLGNVAEYDLNNDMSVCYNSIAALKEDFTPKDLYHIRRSITKLAHSASVGKLTLASLLEGHNQVDREYAPSRLIMQGCQRALETESKALDELWKTVNT